jgi:hypothetical protein
MFRNILFIIMIVEFVIILSLLIYLIIGGNKKWQKKN